MKRIRKNDMILAAVVLAAAGGLLLLQYFKADASAGSVAVYQGKERIASYPLTADDKIVLSGIDGGTNMLVICDGQAYIKEADCPDGLCIKQGSISQNGQSIICLPHQLVITIEGEDGTDAGTDAAGIDAAGIDAVAR